VESQHHLRAIDLSSGAERWSFPLVGVYISPAVAGKYVFVRSEADNKGQMLALDINTGKQLWAFTPKRLSSPDNSYFGGHLTSPVVVDGTIFVGAGQEFTRWMQHWRGSLDFRRERLHLLISHCVSGACIHFRLPLPLRPGSTERRRGLGASTTLSIYFSPVVAGQIVLLNDGEGLSALDATSGKQLWTANIPSQALIPGAVSGVARVRQIGLVALRAGSCQRQTVMAL